MKQEKQRTVTPLYDLMFNQCKSAEVVQNYVGETYIQHSPGVADGKQAFFDYFTRNGTGVSA